MLSKFSIIPLDNAWPQQPHWVNKGLDIVLAGGGASMVA
jgi:hypothetical protein